MSSNDIEVTVHERVVYSTAVDIVELRVRLADMLEVDSMEDDEILDAAVQHEATADWLSDQAISSDNEVIGTRLALFQQGSSQVYANPIIDGVSADSRLAAMTDNDIEAALIKMVQICDSVRANQQAGTPETLLAAALLSVLDSASSNDF